MNLMKTRYSDESTPPFRTKAAEYPKIKNITDYEEMEDYSLNVKVIITNNLDIFLNIQTYLEKQDFLILPKSCIFYLSERMLFKKKVKILPCRYPIT